MDPAAEPSFPTRRDASSAPSRPVDPKDTSKTRPKSPSSPSRKAKQSLEEGEGLVHSWELRQFANEPIVTSLLSPDRVVETKQRKGNDVVRRPLTSREMKGYKRFGKKDRSASTNTTPAIEEPRSLKRKSSLKSPPVFSPGGHWTPDYSANDLALPPFRSQMDPVREFPEEDDAAKDENLSMTSATPSGTDDAPKHPGATASDAEGQGVTWSSTTQRGPRVQKDSLSIIRKRRPSLKHDPGPRSPLPGVSSAAEVLGAKLQTPPPEDVNDDDEAKTRPSSSTKGQDGASAGRKIREGPGAQSGVVAAKDTSKSEDNTSGTSQERRRAEDLKRKATKRPKGGSVFFGRLSGLDIRKARSDREVTPPDRHRCKLFVRRCSENMLLGLLVGGIGGGLALGHALRVTGISWTARPVMYLAFPGELLVRMLSGISVPLLISSIIAAMGSMRQRMLATVGCWTLLLWTAMKVLAVATGVTVTASLKPGLSDHTVTISTVPATKSSFLVVDKVLDLLRNMFPSNVIEACVYSTYTELAAPPPGVVGTIGNASSVESRRFSLVKEKKPNQLGLIMFCSLVGLVLSRVDEEHNAVLNFFVSLSNAIMIVTQIIMWYSPIGVCSLIASNVVLEPSGSLLPNQLWTSLMVALGIHVLVTLPLLYIVFVRRRCIQFFVSLITPLATAFGTGSSFMAMPATINALEDSLMMDPRVVRLIVPLGGAINKDGATICSTVLLCYFVQRYELPMAALDYVLLGTLAVLASIGVSTAKTDPMTPLVFLLDAAGLPTDEASIVLLLHWSVDRLATAVNVMGDAVSAAVVQSLSGDTSPFDVEHHRDTTIR